MLWVVGVRSVLMQAGEREVHIEPLWQDIGGYGNLIRYVKGAIELVLMLDVDVTQALDMECMFTFWSLDASSSPFLPSF